MVYKVVVSDLDGTLLLPNHTISVFTRDTLQKLIKKGIYFAFATGRHHVDVAQIRQNLSIPAYMITSNGARVHNAQNELVFSCDLAEDIAHELATMFYDDSKIVTHIYRNDTWLVCRECPEESAFFQDSHFEYELYQPQTLPLDGIAKVFFVSEDPVVLRRLENDITKKWGSQVNVNLSLHTCLEVTAGGISKGHALERILPFYGATLEECIAFGDGMNDEGLLSMVGKGCIMQNGSPRLKAKLPHLEVIGTNGHNAVAHYLHGLFF